MLSSLRLDFPNNPSKTMYAKPNILMVVVANKTFTTILSSFIRLNP